MNDNTPTPPAAPNWNTGPGKAALVRGIFEYLRDNEGERERCLRYDDGYDIVNKVAKSMGMTVPPDARVLFLPEGDWEKGDPLPQKMIAGSGLNHYAGSSLIIDLPPKGTDIDESLRYACTYTPWVDA